MINAPLGMGRFVLAGLLAAIMAASAEASPDWGRSHSPHRSGAVLATPYQIRTEREILRIVSSMAMQAEIAKVVALYAADPQGKTPAGKARIQVAAHSIAVAAAQYAVGEDSDRPGILWTVNAPHHWHHLIVPRSGYGIDNPDNVYRSFSVAGSARYTVRGHFPPNRPAELHFEMRDAIPGTTAMTAEGGKQLSTLRSDEIVTDGQGNFTITVDSKPANGRPNHLQTPEKGKVLVVVRDLFTDWATQEPTALSIQRIDGPPIAPAPHHTEFIKRATALLRQIAPYWVNYDNQFLFSRPANQLSAARMRPGGRGISASAHFALKPDEAWVITVDAIGAQSLGVQLCDPWGVAYDYATRTSSLNRTQAKPNADGTYTFVVSERDPGVYNWLDPQGQPAGILVIRWQSLPPGAKADDAIRSAQLVPIAQLRNVLPEGTVFTSLADRQAQRAARAAQYRRRLKAR
ncbi:MAG: hypothetical protein RLZZ136_1375 [Pseudomonadota bacterium]|jgi:hypothetical protein